MKTVPHPIRCSSVSLLSLAIPLIAAFPVWGQVQLLLDGDFDNLTVGTAPDRGVPNGAWAFPDDYCCVSGGESREPSNRKEMFSVVESSSFDPTNTGLSLELNDNPKSDFTALSNFFSDAIKESDGGILRVNYDVYVPTSEGRVGGGIVHLSSDPVGFGGLSIWTDVGPAVQWEEDNSIRVVECNSFVTDCRHAGASWRQVLDEYPRDAWQHVQLDIDLVADKYDLSWSAGDDSLQEIATDLDFVAGRKRELDRFSILNPWGRDGGHMYVDNVSATWVPSSPNTTISLSGADGVYEQNFDAALGIDSSVDDQPLPPGWTGSRNGIATSHLTTKTFPTGSVGRGTLVYNAGENQDSDRALGLGIGSETNRGTLQLLADVTDAPAQQLQLAFDVEVWDAATSRSTTDPGEAAFDVSIEIDGGDGFVPLLDLGRVTTGPILTKPANSSDFVNGNDTANRVTFDSGLIPANIPVGSQLRVRWSADQDASRGWVFGLDNVSVSLLGGAHPGDFNGDGVLGIDDLNLISSEIALGGTDPRYDVDQSGVVDLADRQHWVTDMKRTWIGDSNLDGVFDSADLIAIFSADEYEDGIAQNSSWSTGDWNGDGEFDSSDLIAAFNEGGYEAGRRSAVSAVPEPSSVVLLACSVLVLSCRRSRGFSQ